MFKVGVVGLGLGYSHATIIRDNPRGWQLTAVCDSLEDRIQRILVVADGVRGFTDYLTFLSNADLDGVVLAVPHDLHASMAIAALERGLHVLVEKPMACTVAECEQMNAAAVRSGKTLMVAQNWRYTPWVVAARQIVESGELGALRAVRTEWLQNAVNDPRPGNWLLDGKRAGGGPVISLMVHNLDCLRYLLGEPYTVQAFCLRGHPAFLNDAENWSMAQFTFENGVIGQMFTSYSAYSPVDSGPLWLYGEDGTLFRRDESLRISSRARGTAYEPVEILDNAGLPTQQAGVNELLHFMECAQTGSEPLSSGRDNIKTIRFVEAIYESARCDAPVTL